MTQTDGLILLITDSLTLCINRQTGALAHLSRPGGESAVGRSASNAALDARLDGRWLGEPTRYLSHSVEDTGEGVALVVTIALGGLEITDRFHLVGSLAERIVRVSLPTETTGEGRRVQLKGLRLVVPGVAIRAADICRFEAPACAVRP